MKTIEAEIEGIAPILFNRFFDSASLNKQGKKKKTQQEYDDETKFKTYKDEKGVLGIPAMNLKKAMLLAVSSAGIKIGKKSAMPYLRATVFFDKDFLSFGVKKIDGVHECTGRRPPKTGGAVLIKRPYLKEGWKTSFKLLLVDDRISSNMVRMALDEAGLIIGIGDHRPEFGRFKVIKFEINE